jgi:hypothetical protein
MVNLLVEICRDRVVAMKTIFLSTVCGYHIHNTKGVRVATVWRQEFGLGSEKRICEYLYLCFMWRVIGTVCEKINSGMGFSSFPHDTVSTKALMLQ